MSYAHEDRAIALELTNRLTASGLHVWIDRDMPPGDPFVARIELALSEADVVVFLASRNSIDSKWVKEEYQIATRLACERGLRMVPLRLDESPLPAFLANRSYVAWDAGKGYPELLRGIRSVAANSDDGAIVEVCREAILGHLPVLSTLIGRERDLALLNEHITRGVRVLGIAGLPGAGKTSLALHLFHEHRRKFDFAVWQSLRECPGFAEMARSWLHNLRVHGSRVEVDVPILDGVVRSLGARSCLIVLDNAESVLGSGADRASREAYGQLLKKLVELDHRSCVIVTMRETPSVLAGLGAQEHALIYPLPGLQAGASAELLRSLGVTGTDEQVSRAADRYSGNPLALRLLASNIKNIYSNDVSAFLADASPLILPTAADLLDAEFTRLTSHEKDMLYWLAIRREPTSAGVLGERLAGTPLRDAMSRSLDSLYRHSLVDVHRGQFTLQNFVMEFVTERFVACLAGDILGTGQGILATHAVIEANSAPRVREIQERLVARPVVSRLHDSLGSMDGVRACLERVLSAIRARGKASAGYGPGNVVNLLRAAGFSTDALDLSRTVLRSAFLPNATLHDSSFKETEIVECVFRDHFHGVYALAFSPDASCLAFGTEDGAVIVVRVASAQHVWRSDAAGVRVRALAFSGSGEHLVAGFYDGMLRAWSVDRWHLVWEVRAHAKQIRTIATSPTDDVLVTGGEDGAAHVWSVDSGARIKSLGNLGREIWALAFSPDGDALVCVAEESDVQFWEARDWSLSHYGAMQERNARCAAWSPDGRLIALGAARGAMCLMNADSGTTAAILTDSGAGVWGVTFAHGGQSVVCGTYDGNVNVWDVRGRRLVRTLLREDATAWPVVSSRDDRYLGIVIGGRRVSVWDTADNQVAAEFRGYSCRTWACVVGDERRILTGHADGSVRVWDRRTDGHRQIRVHDGGVRSAAVCPVSGHIAVGGEENDIVVLLGPGLGTRQRLPGHTNWVWCLVFSCDGTRLISGGGDGAIRVWDTADWKEVLCLSTDSGHRNRVRCLAISSEGSELVSGGDDCRVLLWSLITAAPTEITSHAKAVTGVGWLGAETLVVSGSADGIIRVTRRSDLRVVHEHEVVGGVSAVARVADDQCIVACTSGAAYMLSKGGGSLDPCVSGLGPIDAVGVDVSGRQLVFAGQRPDITVVGLGTHIYERLRVRRMYEGLDITGVLGLTAAERTTLLALGAVDSGSPEEGHVTRLDPAVE